MSLNWMWKKAEERSREPDEPDEPDDIEDADIEVFDAWIQPSERKVKTHWRLRIHLAAGDANSIYATRETQEAAQELLQSLTYSSTGWVHLYTDANDPNELEGIMVHRARITHIDIGEYEAPSEHERRVGTRY